MEVSTIANFRTVQNRKQQSQQIKTTNYHQPMINTRMNNKPNSPNFGKFILDDLFFWGKKNLNKVREAQKQYHIKNVQKRVQNDTKILSKRLGISEYQAGVRYQEDLNVGGIKPTYDAKQQKGLNKVIGYSLEKLELLKQAVVPIIKHQEAIKTGKPVPFGYDLPGGIILHGEPGTGKSHMAESFIEHMDLKAREKGLKINTVIIDKPWDKGDTDENLFALWKTFEKAQKDGKNGEHTVLW